ncbi:hypothetical protein Tco_0437911, partial [Tanacetum coccineum]
DDIGSREFTIYKMMKGCSVWSVRKGRRFFFVINLSGKVVQYNLISKTLHEILDMRSNKLNDNHDDDELIPPFEAVLDELIEITGSTKLHKRMRFWFVQEIAEEEGFAKFLRDRYDDLRRHINKRHVLIGEMEALRVRGVAVDCLECLTETQAKETDKLASLTEVLVEIQAGIHEKEGHVARMDLND